MASVALARAQAHCKKNLQQSLDVIAIQWQLSKIFSFFFIVRRFRNLFSAGSF